MLKNKTQKNFNRILHKKHKNHRWCLLRKSLCEWVFWKWTSHTNESEQLNIGTPLFCGVIAVRSFSFQTVLACLDVFPFHLIRKTWVKSYNRTSKAAFSLLFYSSSYFFLLHACYRGFEFYTMKVYHEMKWCEVLWFYNTIKKILQFH